MSAETPLPSFQVLAGTVEQLQRFAAGGYLFAIMDGCFCPQVLDHLQQSAPSRVMPLLAPTPELNGAPIPALIQVDGPMLEFILAEVGQNPWGVFAMSKSDLDSLRLHFRRFLVVELPDGDNWLFRFFDPRLLPTYLNHCEDWELQKFFGPVRGFGIPSGESIAIVQYKAEEMDSSRVRTDPNASLVWHIRPEQARALSQSGD